MMLVKHSFSSFNLWNYIKRAIPCHSSLLVHWAEKCRRKLVHNALLCVSNDCSLVLEFKCGCLLSYRLRQGLYLLFNTVVVLYTFWYLVQLGQFRVWPLFWPGTLFSLRQVAILASQRNWTRWLIEIVHMLYQYHTCFVTIDLDGLAPTCLWVILGSINASGLNYT